MSAKSRLTGRTSALLGLLSIALLSGCGQAKRWETVYPVKGTVTHKGKPVKNAELAFFPLDDQFPESVRPRAKSNENGEFVVSTYGTGDGAPSGIYKVTVVHHEVVLSKDTVTTKPNSLPKKYAAKDTTELEVEVAERETAIPTWNLK